MKKKKILFLLVEGEYSGAQNVVINIINGIKDMYECVYSSMRGEVENALKENNIKFVPYEKPTYRQIKKIIHDVKPDIIHAHDFTASILSSLVTFKIPCICHLHNNSPWIKKICIKSLVFGLSCFRYDKILTVSSSVMDEFIFGKCFKRKTSVIGNPIDISRIREKGYDGVAPSSDIIFLGRLTEQKNPKLFLNVIAGVKAEMPSISAAMVGDGDLRKEVEKEIKRLNLESCVKLYGFKENPYIFLNNSKLLCIPSSWEGFGLVAVEALAFGIPVIASPVGGLVSIIDESCGSFCRNEEDFCKEIKKYLEDENYYSKKSKGAIAKAQLMDNYNDYISFMMNIYSEYSQNRAQ